MEWLMKKAGDEQLNVGELIAALKSQPADNKLHFDFCGIYPTNMRSYRGYYEDLAIEPSNLGTRRHDNDREPPTVGDFMAKLEALIGTEMGGYKGGDYLIRKSTPIWVSQWGEASGTFVTGVVRNSYGYSYITTAQVLD